MRTFHLLNVSRISIHILAGRGGGSAYWGGSAFSGRSAYWRREVCLPWHIGNGDPPVNRQTPVKTLPSPYFLCVRQQQTCYVFSNHCLFREMGQNQVHIRFPHWTVWRPSISTTNGICPSLYYLPSSSIINAILTSSINTWYEHLPIIVPSECCVQRFIY